MLKKLWKKWKMFAYKVGEFNTRIFLMIFYFLFLTPFALVVRLFSDPLKIKEPETSWNEREGGIDSVEDMRRQY